MNNSFTAFKLHVSDTLRSFIFVVYTLYVPCTLQKSCFILLNIAGFSHLYFWRTPNVDGPSLNFACSALMLHAAYTLRNCASAGFILYLTLSYGIIISLFIDCMKLWPWKVMPLLFHLHCMWFELIKIFLLLILHCMWLASCGILLLQFLHCLWPAHCRIALLSFSICLWSSTTKSCSSTFHIAHGLRHVETCVCSFYIVCW